MAMEPETVGILDRRRVRGFCYLIGKASWESLKRMVHCLGVSVRLER